MNITARDYTFAEWLQLQLKKLDIKPIQFAEISKISRSGLSRYLSGSRIPKAAKQELLVKAFCKMTDMSREEVEQKILWHCYISERRRQR